MISVRSVSNFFSPEYVRYSPVLDIVDLRWSCPVMFVRSIRNTFCPVYVLNVSVIPPYYRSCVSTVVLSNIVRCFIHQVWKGQHKVEAITNTYKRPPTRAGGVK